MPNPVSEIQRPPSRQLEETHSSPSEQSKKEKALLSLCYGIIAFVGAQMLLDSNKRISDLGPFSLTTIAADTFVSTVFAVGYLISAFR